MKLKAPEGVGDPCVAGVVIDAHNGIYEVEAEIGALLIECFGFVEVSLAAGEPEKPAPGRRSKTPSRKATSDKATRSGI